VVAGGGAAGFFAAIVCAEASPGAKVTVVERSPQFLSKVRISGGGRCNVTHACFDVRELSGHYPRGGSALRGAFAAFQPRDAISWFETRGVRLKTEADGRMFPVSNSSETVVECLMRSARLAGVELIANCGVEEVARRPEGGFLLTLTGGRTLGCERLMLATGGCRAAAGIMQEKKRFMQEIQTSLVIVQDNFQAMQVNQTFSVMQQVEMHDMLMVQLFSEILLGIRQQTLTTQFLWGGLLVLKRLGQAVHSSSAHKADT